MIFLKELINSAPVVFFSKDQCRYCDLLEEDLSSLHIPFKKIKIEDKFKEELIEFTSLKTVPQLFIGGQFIGGYSEFTKLLLNPDFEKSELVKILKPLGIHPVLDF